MIYTLLDLYLDYNQLYHNWENNSDKQRRNYSEKKSVPPSITIHANFAIFISHYQSVKGDLALG